VTASINTIAAVYSDTNSIAVKVYDPAVYDTDGNGIPDDPFQVLDVFADSTTTTIVLPTDFVDYGVQVVLVALRDDGNAGTTDEPVTITLTNPATGETVDVTLPTRSELLAALGLSTTYDVAVILRIGPLPDLLIDSGTIPAKNLIAGGQYIQLSLLVDDGSKTVTQQDFPAGQAPDITFNGLPAETNTKLYTYDTDVLTGSEVTIGPASGADWTFVEYKDTDVNGKLVYEDAAGNFILAPTEAAFTLYRVDPAFGPESGGTLVTVYGSFKALDTAFDQYEVLFGDTAAPVESLYTATATEDGYVTCTTPAHDKGKVDVTVRWLDDLTDFDTLPDAYFFGQYQLQVLESDPADGGTTIPAENGEYGYNPGETAEVEAVDALGWDLDDWKVDGASVSSIDNPYSQLMDADHTIQAIFATALEYEVVTEPASLMLEPGETYNLSTTVTKYEGATAPEDQTDDITLTYQSNDETVATVDSAGTVTAVALGNALVTASFMYDGTTWFDTTDVTVSVAQISDIQPSSAWAFGGVVAKITGSGFRADDPPAVSFGSQDVAGADVEVYSETELYVVVPKQTFTGATLAVDVTVDDSTLTDGFTYVNYQKNNGITTTAFQLSTTNDIFLDANAPTNKATLTNATKVSSNVLARTSTTAADFGVGNIEGSEVAGIWNFDLHVYEPVTNTKPLSVLGAGGALFVEATANTLSLKLSFDLPADTVEVADVEEGAASLWGVPATLDYVLPTDTVASRTASTSGVYQSTILSAASPAEYTSAGGTYVDSVTARIESFSGGAFVLRTDAYAPAPDATALTPSATQGEAGDPVTVTSTQGRLGYPTGVLFTASTSKQSSGTAAITSTNGETEDSLSFTVPEVAPGDYNIEITIAGGAKTTLSQLFKVAVGVYSLQILESSPAEGGTTDPEEDASYEYAPNSTATITATPARGWQLDDWNVDNVSVSETTNPYSLLMDADHTIQAIFAATLEYEVTITPATLTLEVGKTSDLTTTVTQYEGSADPVDVTDDVTLSYASSNDAVATVNSAGKVKAIAAGTATITASFVNDGTTWSGTSAITVNAAPVTPDDRNNFVGLFALLAALLFGGAAGGDGGGGGGPCFIATAAYGSPMADHIDALREVRDTYFLNNAVGTALVDTYYRFSPAVADVVAKSPVLAAAVRIALLPVVLLSKLVLAMPGVSMLLAAFATVMMVVRRRKA